MKGAIQMLRHVHKQMRTKSHACVHRYLSQNIQTTSTAVPSHPHRMSLPRTPSLRLLLRQPCFRQCPAKRSREPWTTTHSQSLQSPDYWTNTTSLLPGTQVYPDHTSSPSPFQPMFRRLKQPTALGKINARGGKNAVVLIHLDFCKTTVGWKHDRPRAQKVSQLSQSIFCNPTQVFH